MKHPAFAAPDVRPPSENHLAEVVSVEDVGTSGRLKVKLLTYDGAEGQNGSIDARVCVPFAGKDMGAFLIPNVGDEVVVNFINGDPRQAVVVGAVWNGKNLPKDAAGNQRIDKWTLTGKKGTRVALLEEQDGSATIELSTPGGVSATFTQEAGGAIELSAGGSSIRIDSSGIELKSAAEVSINAPAGMTTTAPFVDTSAGQASFSGLVQAPTAQTSTIISATYTPGAGNVW